MGRKSIAEIIALGPEAVAAHRAKRNAEPRLTMAELEARNPERAERIRAYDRMCQKRNLADPVRAEKIRANDREREKFRDRPRMAEIIELDPEKAARIREKQRAKWRALRARYKSQNLARFLWQNVRGEAKRKGVEFDLTVEWFDVRIKAGICEMSGLPFNFESRADYPSVDRILPGGHYTQGNCRLILYSLNVALGNWGEEYVLKVFRHVLARRGG